MRLRWVHETGEFSRGCAVDLPILVSLMEDAEPNFCPDCVEVQFAYPDDRFFPVWRRGVGTVMDEVPERFLDEINAYFKRRERFRARKPTDWCSIETNWVYDDDHHTMEYVPDFEGLVEILNTLSKVPRLVRFEVGYEGVEFFTLWTKEDGFEWGLPPRFLRDWTEYRERNGGTPTLN